MTTVGVDGARGRRRAGVAATSVAVFEYPLLE